MFGGPPLRYTLEQASNRLLDRAANLPASAWDREQGQPPPDIAADLAATVTLETPSLDWGSLTFTTGEASVAVREWYNSRAAYVTAHVPGARVVASIPYAGNRLLLTAAPSQHYLGGFDPAVRVDGAALGGEVVVTIDGRHIDPAKIHPYLEKVALDIEKHLDWARADVSSWASDLSNRLAYVVGERAAFHAEISVLEARLKPSEVSEATTPRDA